MPDINSRESAAGLSGVGSAGGVVRSDSASRSNQHQHAPSLAGRLIIGTLFAMVVLAISVVTVFRYTAPYLQADGVGQAMMSVQDVDLFFWGQNRFASVVAFLASPVADPMLNLFLCLLINAVAYHALLVVVSWMGVHLVAGRRNWQCTLLLFLVLTAVTHTIVTDEKLYSLTLESQPFALSWTLALGSFLLWKRREWWAFVLAAAMVGLAVGLNQSTVLIAAFLAVFEMVRRRQWVRWPILGVAWIVWLGVWATLASWYGGNAGPILDPEPAYFGIHPGLFASGIPQSFATIAAGLRPVRIIALVLVGCVATLLIGTQRRPALLSRLAMTILYCTLFWLVFTGNAWVSANGFNIRYFFPVVLGLILVLAVPLAAALLRLPDFLRAPGGVWWPTAVTAVLCVGALVGPLTPPSQSAALLATRATADYARANDVAFLSGYFWPMWPIELQTLDGGRTSTYVTAAKSGGDPAAYQAALDRELAESDGPPRAMCVDEEISVCVTYLEYWTRPGWQEVPGDCPVPISNPLNGSPPVQACRLLEFRP